MDRPKLDPATATEYEIVAAADAMLDRRLDELATTSWGAKTSDRHSKGGAGAIVEAYFGIKQNSDQEPDFRAAGIELKVAPLVVEDGTPKRIKERTSVSMIDYIALDQETWRTASVKKKIRRILFVFYAWKPDTPLGEMRVVARKLWSPGENLWPFLERDWRAVWAKNHSGRAHEISEGDGLVMGACTKGAKGGMRTQPRSTEPAKSRAWSLKPRLTWTIYESTREQERGDALLRELLGESPVDPVVALLHRFEAMVGSSVQQVADEHDIVPGDAKNRAATVLRKAVGLRPRSMPPELEALGLEVKTVPLGPNADTFEAMSFPAFDHRELPDEQWEDSDLFGRLQNMLLVPLFRENREDELMTQRVCRPFRWSPDQEQLRGIRAEWERYRDLVAAGHAEQLPKQSETSFIHVRPHGRDGEDREKVPGGHEVVKKSFWLNQDFVRELVLSHHSDWKGF